MSYVPDEDPDEDVCEHCGDFKLCLSDYGADASFLTLCNMCWLKHEIDVRAGREKAFQEAGDYELPEARTATASLVGPSCDCGAAKSGTPHAKWCSSCQ